MNCGKATKITASTFHNLPKLFVYRLLITLLSLGIGCVIVLPSVSYILKSEELAAIFETLREIIRTVLHGEDLSAFGERLSNNLTALLQLVYSKKLNVIFVYVGVILALLIQNFFTGLSSFVYGNMVNDYMSSMANFGFFRSFFRYFKQACLYQIVVTLLGTAYRVVVSSLLFYLLSLFLSWFAVLALPFVFMLGIVLFALYHTVMNGFMPAVIADKISVGAALKASFAQVKNKKRFATVFGTYCFALAALESIVVLAILPTFGAALFFAPTVCTMWTTALSFTLYYTFTDKKYYLDYDPIVVPKALRKEESLLSEIDV